jgi:hypothetical protein
MSQRMEMIQQAHTILIEDTPTTTRTRVTFPVRNRHLIEVDRTAVVTSHHEVVIKDPITRDPAAHTIVGTPRLPGLVRSALCVTRRIAGPRIILRMNVKAE